MNIPSSAPTKLEVQSSPEGIFAGEEERHNPPTEPEQAEVFSPYNPLCSEATLLYYTFLFLPKGWKMVYYRQQPRLSDLGQRVFAHRLIPLWTNFTSRLIFQGEGVVQICGCSSVPLLGCETLTSLQPSLCC